MRQPFSLGRVLLLAAGAIICTAAAEAVSLEEGFRNPPNSAKPHTWYHLMNGNVTKEGITCDFEALAKAGIGGVQMFDAGCDIPPGPLAFNSPEWFDMFQHAASEARRLGLEICIPNCSGWSSSGGPWNAPSNGMKKVVFTETAARGPSAFSAKLPRTSDDNGFYDDIAVLAFPTPPAESASFPDVKTELCGTSAVLSASAPFTAKGVSFRLSFPKIWNGRAEAKVEVSRDGASFEPLETFRAVLSDMGVRDYSMRFHSFPRDVTARAIRISFASSVAVKVEEFRPEAKIRLSDLPAKTFGMRTDFAVDSVAASQDQVVPVRSVVDITKRMSPDGTLSWNVPEGDWTIMRIGYVCNGRCNHPASKFGIGLEVDKLSASAMDHHFDQYVAKLCARLGPLAGDVESGFNNILVDSYEVGPQNWTQGMEKEFEKRMRYSPLPYLPVLAGRVVGSVDESERFLEDFRRVVADMFAENYAGRLAELCHRHGLKLSLEPYGNCPADNLQYGQDVDIPMAEFWSKAKSGDHCTRVGNARMASYLAHVWGRRYAATESFTADPYGGGRWLTTPFSIKAQCDAVYCEGVNRIIYHRFAHQPWPGSKYLPGMTMGRWGMHLDRTQTWWDFAGPWFRYQARCQWMLQEGRPTADVLFFCGEESPNQGGNADNAAGRFPDEMKLSAGYNWDMCATKALMALKVVDGNVVVPGGVSYRLLVLPSSDTMSEHVLSKINELVSAGAKVCARVKPTRFPGLVEYPVADEVVRSAAEGVWAKGVMTCRPAEALAKLGVEPDFASSQNDPAPSWIHRRTDASDWYFVALNNAKERTFEVSFRQTGREPEIWDAEKGTIHPAEEWREEGGRTYVTLSFPPSGSAFVVFRRGTGNAGGRMSSSAAAREDTRPPVPVIGPWRVVFPIGWYFGTDEAKTVDMPELVDWTSFSDPDIKYFSGTATYTAKIPLPSSPLPSSLVLDLGEVKNFAEVTVNGKTFEVLWRPPYRVDITEALGGRMFSSAAAREDTRPPVIDLSVRVTNLWPNRLIGDDILYADDCEWTGEVKNGVKEIGIKEIPQWVKDGKPSPTGRHTFTTWKHWDKNDKLLPSGLLGPVQLILRK